MNKEPGQRLKVQAQDDHLVRVAGTDPLLGLDELVWNSLDADARRIDVTLERGPLDELRRIVVEDDGDGFSRADALHAFTSLGGSMKFGRTTTARGRMLHGQKGEGGTAPSLLAPSSPGPARSSLARGCGRSIFNSRREAWERRS